MAPIPVWPGEFVSLGETRVFVRTAPATSAATETVTGSTAEPVVCVHGFGGSSTNWTDLMALLSDPAPGGPAYHCEALHLPGFGFSPPAEASCTVSGQAALVAQLIEQRGRGPVHLVGNSFGGAACTRVAATRPDLIKTVTLVAPAMPDLWVRPVTARFPALCVPKFGSWLLNRVQKMTPLARVEASIGTIYYDGRCVHPDRIAYDIAEIERRDALGYGDAVLIRCARSIVAEYLRLGPPSLWRGARPGRSAGPGHLRQPRQDRRPPDGRPRGPVVPAQPGGGAAPHRARGPDGTPGGGGGRVPPDGHRAPGHRAGEWATGPD